jgi:hypothetical protein
VQVQRAHVGVLDHGDGVLDAGGIHSARDGGTM